MAERTRARSLHELRGTAGTGVAVAVAVLLLAFVGGTAAAPRSLAVHGDGTFDAFDPSKTGHSWANSYLLSTLSDRVYAPSGASWNAFKASFEQSVGALARTGETFTFDFVRSTQTGTEAVVVTDSKAVIVVFRGTESSSLQTVITDWSTDGNAFLASAPKNWGKHMRVHAGFRGAMNSVYGTLRTTVINRRGGTRKVWVTGHSLGGALATLFAYRLNKLSKIPIQGVHTYGQPRVGNFFWKIYYGTLLGPRTQRWAHMADPVIRFPPAAGPGQQKSGYYHVGTHDRISPNGSIKLNAAEALSVPALGNHLAYTQRIYEGMPASVRATLPAPGG